MKKVLLVLAPVVFVMMTTSSAMMATGCGGGGSGGSGGGGGGGGGGSADAGLSTTCDANPAAETSATVFTKVVQPVCTTCHTCPGGAGCSYGDYGDAAKTYTALVGVASLYGTEKKVAPNDLAHSTAYLKTGCSPITNVDCTAPDGTHIGAAMPQGGPNPVTADQLKTLKDWICRGAPQ